MLDELKSAPGYWYLASPYSKYPAGIEAAFKDVCLAAGRLIERGVKVYSPIAHTHPIAVHSGMDPYDHKIWLPADEPFMHGAYGLLVLMMDTWKQSYGIGVEIEEFRNAGKPVIFLHWPLQLSQTPALTSEQA